jgi:hypothetical protein
MAWRYLLAGIVIIGVMGISIFWLFGDPASVPHSTLPTIRPPVQPVSPSDPAPRLSIQQQRQQVEESLRQQLQSLDAQMAETNLAVDRLHERILQITSETDLARQALTVLRHAQEAEDQQAGR